MKENNQIVSEQEAAVTPKLASTVDELFSQIADMFDNDQKAEINSQQGGQMTLDTPSLVDTVLSFDDEDDNNSEPSQQLLSSASPFCFPASTTARSQSSPSGHLLSPYYSPQAKRLSSYSSPSPSDSDYESLASPASSDTGLESAFEISVEQDPIDQLFPSLLCPENY